MPFKSYSNAFFEAVGGKKLSKIVNITSVDESWFSLKKSCVKVALFLFFSAILLFFFFSFLSFVLIILSVIYFLLVYFLSLYWILCGVFITTGNEVFFGGEGVLGPRKKGIPSTPREL